MTAYNAKGSGEGVETQATKYLYASTINRSWQTAVVYPDSTDTLSQDQDTKVWTISSGSDHTSTDYDRLGRQISTTDQRGVVHEYTFDAAGRLSDDTAAELGSSGDVDGLIRSIHTSYDDVGRVQTVTSLGDDSGGPAVPYNQVEYIYDGWGNLAAEYQAHDGEVDEGTPPAVQYRYDDGASGGVAAYLRLSDVTYPGGNRHVGYNYAAGVDNIMSRLSDIFDDTDGDGVFDTPTETAVSSYKYLGAGQIVVEDYVDTATRLSYFDENGDLTRLDRFGRVVDQVWEQYDQNGDVTAEVDHYHYEYDRAGNRTARENVLKADNSLDETYQYDDLDRLVEWAVGGTTQKTWTLDALGNNLDAGTYTAANEETPTGLSGDVYDKAGNMLKLQSGNSAIYDAWNRLVEVDDGETILQRNEYDGANRRIQIFTDFNGSTPGTAADDYFKGRQVIETREAVRDQGVLGPSEVKYQNIWSPRYIDSLILRDTYDTVANERVIDLDQRIFYLADANYNVTGLVKQVESEWQVVERYRYTAYGDVKYLNPDWTDATSSANNNTILYTGRVLDLATGLMYYRARFYDAVLERFINRDPIGYRGEDANLYRYVSDRPLSFSDPSGLVLHGDTTQGAKDLLQMVLSTPQRCGCKPRHILAYAPGNPVPPGSRDNKPGEFPVNDLGDLIYRIGYDANSYTEANAQCNCVGVLELWGHAHGGRGVTIGPGAGNVDTNSSSATLIDINNADFVGQQLAKGVNFCKPCMIILNACNSGNSLNTNTVPQTLASRTGCIVYAAGGYSHGSFFDGNPSTHALYFPDMLLGHVPGTGQTLYQRDPNRRGDSCDSKCDRWYLFLPKPPANPK
jgi:RHS repeat-associated protein